MSPTVDALRNEIRVSVGRYERDYSTAFTKEALAAICEAVGYDVDTNRLPSKPQMRAGILWKIGELTRTIRNGLPARFERLNSSPWPRLSETSSGRSRNVDVPARRYS